MIVEVEVTLYCASCKQELETNSAADGKIEVSLCENCSQRLMCPVEDDYGEYGEMER